MDAILKKLNFKQQAEILVLHAPENLTPLIAEWKKQTAISKRVKKSVEFAVVFCITQKDVDSAAQAILSKAQGDAIIWFCYPKGTSKRYKCEFNRDNGWKVPGKLGWEPVRMVAIDEDWSALRFRRVEFLKKMTRKFAISKEGKSRITGKKA
ncbi:MAG: hypothetical protein U1F27_01125 [Turneriella sp.]